MLRGLKELKDYTVRGSEGDLGSVKDFYFDDNDWMIRYLILETGDWLEGRHVLLSPVALGKPDMDAHLIPTGLTKELVRNSPDLPFDRPISRDHEIELFDYYQWPAYWGPPTVSGAGPGNVLAAYPMIELGEEMQENAGSRQQDHHLRSIQDVFDYGLHARDGKIGSLEDFIVEFESWKIVYLIVDAGNWLSNKKVLVSPTWVEKVSWTETSIYVDLSRETIRNSPEYDPSLPLDRGYETRLYDHYGREKYW